MSRGYVVVEGRGEERAVLNLVTRLWRDLGLREDAYWAPPIRLRALDTRPSVVRAIEIVRAMGDAERLLILRDDDDGCPATGGPEAARWASAAAVSFPVGVVLAKCEYESLFLASLESIAGKPIKDPSGVLRPGIVKSARFTGDPESKRGVKEWLTEHMPRGKAYKPSVDQTPLTQMVDFRVVRERGLPWFGTLERSLRFLSSSSDAGVYPRPAVG